jgi:hypothetical protein
MKDLKKIAAAVKALDDTISPLREKALANQTRIAEKIANLDRYARKTEASDDQRLFIRKALTDLEILMTQKKSAMSLKQVEEFVDAIYGDQSLNNTYYFSRKNLNQVKAQRQASLSSEPLLKQHLAGVCDALRYQWLDKSPEDATQNLHDNLKVLYVNASASDVVLEDGETLASTLRQYDQALKSHLAGQALEWDQVEQVVGTLSRVASSFGTEKALKVATSSQLQNLHKVIRDLETMAEDDHQKLNRARKTILNIARAIKQDLPDLSRDLVNTSRELGLKTLFMSEVVEDLEYVAVMWELNQSKKASTPSDPVVVGCGMDSADLPEDLEVPEEEVEEDTTEEAGLVIEGNSELPLGDSMTFDEVTNYIAKTYGDQSKNDSYYYTRQTQASSDSLAKLAHDIEAMYGGDQSDNSMYYPSRQEEGTKESNWQTEEQYYLQDQDWDDSKAPVHAGGYFGESFDQDDSDQAGIPFMPALDFGVTTPGYHGDELRESPEMVEKYPQILEASDKSEDPFELTLDLKK